MNTDYVIVGAGSAGCAIAFRLTEAGHTVTILEFGGHDRSPLIQMPAALSYPMNMKRYDWGYWSEPEPHLGGRKLACPRGKVIGGSSSINGMVYVRGHAKDFDTWAEMGASGWSYSDILPYYRRLENVDYTDPEEVEKSRGINGPLNITKGKRMNPLTLAFEKAGAQAGYQSTPDYNGKQQEGFGPMDQTIKNGLRWSSAKAYLKPAIQSGKCQVIRGLATKIIIENSQATGVEYTQGNKKSVLSASKEVIISASSINSPKLLLLSGIGPAAELKSKGITVVANRPGVGKNLQDHLELYIQMASKKPVSLYKYWSPIGKAWVGLRWFISKSGPGASNQFESAAFIRSKAGVEYPDIQYHFLPDFIRDNVESAYHPCGTCKMGDKSDPMSVVDPETRVIGVDKLRVADSSIFPQITNGNLNAPSIMVGEKASDHILGKDLLPRSNEMPWIHPDWHTSQR
ncbi:MAG: hypothetical protein EBX20_03690 [Rhodobacterales bacterium]|nr:hypothetical protein [Rhodobacterales bacterium]